MQARLFVVIGLVCVVGLAAGGHPAHADTDPGCPVVETGSGNTAIGYCATVSGGESNHATDDYGTIGGGTANQAGDNAGMTDDDHSYGTVGGGYSNRASGDGATVGGGKNNRASGSSATVGGGYGNRAIGSITTVSGGLINDASGDGATVGGGVNNKVSGSYATVGGGESNRASASHATIAGGGQSDVSNGATGNRVTDNYGTVGGGGNNQAGDNAGVTTDRIYATVAGGQTNTASGAYATVGGGASNRAQGTRSTVAGGYANLASTTYATVGGGYANRAQGANATVPGGSANVATGANSFAAGTRAKANHQGAFVWGDSTAADVASTANNQFIVRATGGLWLGTTSAPSIPAGRFIQTSTGAYLSSGGAWTNASDRNVKANIAAVDPQAILAKVAQMPVAIWNYKAEDATVKHIGPMAQDFRAAFGVGEDATHISTVDADGVALAAIQGLYQENQDLKARLAVVEAAQRGNAVTDSGLTISWGMIAIGLGGLCVVLLLACVGLSVLVFRRRGARA